MKRILSYFVSETPYSTYHLLSLALFLLGFFIAFTATDLGPFAPLLVSGGIYLAIFSLLLQVLFWFKVGLRKVLSRWLAF
jgi:hypothetical protein